MFLKSIAGRLKKGVKLATKSPIRAGLIGVVAGVILAVGFIVSPMSRADNVSFSSARDCDSNAVMYCGAMTLSELINKYDNNTSTKHIYSYFGISSAEIHNIKADVHAGHVHKNGNVSTGDKIVATDARTAGRLFMPGSTTVTSQGTTFYTRAPSVSFMSDKLDAYVVMKDGVFSYAILASCGNPVKAHPTAKPNYQIAKTVRTGSGSWVENVSIKYGETAEFRVVVKSTGSAPVTDLIVKDKLPADLEYVAGSLKRDGNAANATDFFGDQGIKIAKLPQGDSVVFTFKVTTKQKTQPVPCTSKKVVNLAKMDAANLAPKDDNASVDLTCVQIKHPDYKIVKQVQLIGDNEWNENVTVPSGTKVRFRIVVTSTGDVAVNNLIVGDTLPNHLSYTDNSLLKDGQAVSNDSAFFSGGINVGSLAPGKSITFVFIATAGSVKADASECKEEKLNNIAKADADVLNAITDDASVNTECAKIQRYRCDLLTATSLGDRNFRFDVTYTATSGAKLTTVSYNYGDSSPEYITDKTTSTYQYSKDGTFTASVKLTFMVNGQSQTVTSEDCSTIVSASTPPKMCPIPGKEYLPENDPYCANEIIVVPEVPTEVPNTGPGSIVGLFAGSSILGTLGYRSWVIRRRQ